MSFLFFFFTLFPLFYFPEDLGHFATVFSLKLSEIFPAYVQASRNPRCPARFDLALLHFSISLPTLSLRLSFLPHLSLRIRSTAFPVPSTGTIDVSIPVGWCSLAFATVSACSKSAGVVCPAVLRPPRVPRLRPRSLLPRSLRRSSQPPPLSSPPTRVSSSSQNQWVECSRSSERESAATKVRAREESRDRQTMGFRPVTPHTRHIPDLAPLICPTASRPLKFDRVRRRTSRRHFELLSIVTPC